MSFNKVFRLIFHFLFCIGLTTGLIFAINQFDIIYEETRIILIALMTQFGGPVLILDIVSILSIIRIMNKKSPSRFLYLALTFLFGGIFLTQIALLPQLFTEIADYWFIKDSHNSFRVAMHILWISLCSFSLLATILMGIQTSRIKNDNSLFIGTRKEQKPDMILTKQMLFSFLLMILVITPGYIVWQSVQQPSDNPNPMSAADPIYGIPTGNHNNSSLDTLSGRDVEVLETIETICYNIQKMRAPCGGYATAVNPDFSVWRGDERDLYPNEITLQGATSAGGYLFLKMYELEPNTNYLQLAQDAADAIVEAQDDIYGGFFTFAMFDENNKIIEPHFLNPYRHADFDDGTFQYTLTYLIDFYNTTGEQKYLNSINKALDFLLEAQFESGAWPQETNFVYPFYPSLPTLNDEVMTNNMKLLMKAIVDIPDRAVELKTSLDKAFEWLQEIQGNGGSPMQMGWAEQYDFNDQPAWARSFEPPAFSSRETGTIMETLIQMYCQFNDTKYLDPVEPAYDWLMTCDHYLEECDSPRDIWNKYYELGTNLPIFGVDGGRRNEPGSQYSYNIYDSSKGCGFSNPRAEIGINSWERLVSVDFNITAYQEEKTSNSTFEEVQTAAYNLVDDFPEEGLFFYERDGEYSLSDNYSKLAYLVNYLDLVIS